MCHKQLYVSDLVASITPSVRRLRGFEKVELEAGETKTVTFNITPDDLSFIGKDIEWITEEGEFVIRIDDLEN